jgi:hypothetical protein
MFLNDLLYMYSKSLPLYWKWYFIVYLYVRIRIIIAVVIRTYIRITERRISIDCWYLVWLFAVAADFLILWNSNKTTALLVVLSGARNEGRLLFYPLLVSEDLKQR